MWIEGNASAISDVYYIALDNLMMWLEKDGHQVDFMVAYFDKMQDLEVEVYVDEQLVGLARHWDDIIKIYDSYFEEPVDA
jgi:hypothetical protein